MPTASGGRPAAGTAADARRHLLDVLEPVITSAGYDLDDIAVSTAGRRSVVRVSVDADGGIDLDAVAEVSRAVSAALDADGDGFSGPYVLEVSSPGVDRPLTEHRHWRRAVGRLVEVTVDGTPVTGRVRSATEQVLVLDLDGGPREFGWPSVGAGRIQVEFNPPAAADRAGD
jgi:ribosome maturation factor RimP